MMSPRGRILSLQEERAKTYEEWEIAFKSYIVAGAKEEPYAQACKEATAAFSSISSSIKDVEEELKAESSGLAKWVRELQEAEKGKLQLTIGMQVERKRLGGVQEAVDLVSKAAGLPSLERRSVELAVARANATASPGACSCASIQDELAELEEEMVQRQKEVVKLMQGDLDKLVANINDILDEIRYWGSE